MTTVGEKGQACGRENRMQIQPDLIHTIIEGVRDQACGLENQMQIQLDQILTTIVGEKGQVFGHENLTQIQLDQIHTIIVGVKKPDFIHQNVMQTLQVIQVWIIFFDTKKKSFIIDLYLLKENSYFVNSQIFNI